MKPGFRDRLRAEVAQRFLDLAERFPQIDWQAARTLRIIKENQKARSEEAYTSSRAPEGASLSLRAFRLFEAFHLESFGQLYDGLVKLLPRLLNHPSYREFRSDFDRQSQSLSGSSWQKLGYIVRDEIPSLVRFEVYRRISDLPAEVSIIEVELHRILPSIYTVSFDVHLSDSARERLAQINDRHYLPKLRFHSLLPFKRLGRTIHISGWSLSNSEDEMSHKICEWLDELRHRVEKCLGPYLSGYFRSHNVGAFARLPAIEIYSLSGAPQDKEAYNKWAQDAHFWLDPFGLSQTHLTYSNESLSFSWPRERRQRGMWPHRLVVMREAFLQSVNTEMYGDDENAAIMHETKYTLNELTRPIVLTQYLQSIEKNIEKIRALAVGSMTSSRRLRTYLNQSGNIQRQSHLLDRLSLEFIQEKRLFEHGMKNLGALQFTFPGDEPLKLNDAAVSSIEARINFLKDQLTYVREAFSDFLALRSMVVNYRLQWYVLWLTVIATFAAIMSVIAGWPSIKELWTKISGM
jgi:hypothetical protein